VWGTTWLARRPVAPQKGWVKDGMKICWQRGAKRVIPAQPVRPLGFEPRTCGLRVGLELFLTVPDSPGQTRYQGFQSLTVSDRP
jgi:hypothetical protein